VAKDLFAPAKRIPDLKLTWQQVDKEQGIVRIEAGESKNDEARTNYMDEELNGIVKQQGETRKKAKKLLPCVFFNRKSNDKIKRFDKAWNTACDDEKPEIVFFMIYAARLSGI
jgi:hypothetical protein